MARLFVLLLILSSIAGLIFSILWYARTPQPHHLRAQYHFAKETLQFEYYDYKKTSDDLKYWLPIAKEGNGPAQLYVSHMMYRYGEKNPAYYASALPYLTMAANKGLPLAQNALGVAYLNGLGVQADKLEAYKWFVLAANEGIELALRNKEALARRMTATEISRAKLSADQWRTTPHPEIK